MTRWYWLAKCRVYGLLSMSREDDDENCLIVVPVHRRSTRRHDDIKRTVGLIYSVVCHYQFYAVESGYQHLGISHINLICLSYKPCQPLPRKLPPYRSSRRIQCMCFRIGADKQADLTLGKRWNSERTRCSWRILVERYRHWVQSVPTMALHLRSVYGDLCVIVLTWQKGVITAQGRIVWWVRVHLITCLSLSSPWHGACFNATSGDIGQSHSTKYWLHR